MAQPNVAREPSMEEILASIRRIIESNDPMAARDAVAGLPPVYGGDEDEGEEAIHLTVDDDVPLAFSTVPANDPVPTYHHMPSQPQPVAPVRPAAPAMEFGGAVHQPSNDQTKTSAKSISLADLAARVRAAADRGEPAPRHPSGQTMTAAPQRDIPAPLREAVSDLRGTISPSSAPMPSMAAPYLPRQDEMAPRFQEPEPLSQQHEFRREPQPAQVAVQTPVIQQQPVVATNQYPKAQIVAEPEAVAAPSQPTLTARAPVNALAETIAEDIASKALMSVTAGEQVARSFSELAAAFDGSQRRSLDEMAEEILRPMLHEWLEDNLPTLVERLVREEIERVARGPRR